MAFANKREGMTPIVREKETIHKLHKTVEVRGENRKVHLFEDIPKRKIRKFIMGLPMMKDIRNARITEEKNLITIERIEGK